MPGKSGESTNSNVTLTINGYLYWTLAAPSAYNQIYIMGPPHTVLPRIHVHNSDYETKEWAFYIGDNSSSTTNSFAHDIRHTEPSGSPFSYSVSYSSCTLPTSGGGGGTYEFAINVGGTYSINGSFKWYNT